MKIETRTVYIAFDGARFDSEAECAAYERLHSGSRVAGLTEAEIAAAIAGDNREVADAIEAVAKKVRDARIARGELKRKPKGATGDNGDAQDGDAPQAQEAA